MKYLVIMLLLIATTASAGTCVDRWGNMTYCPDARVNLYRDNLGNTTGAIGRDRVNLYTDNLGNTTGTVGQSRTNIYTDNLGNTTGNVGNQRINCYADRLGNIYCR